MPHPPSGPPSQNWRPVPGDDPGHYRHGMQRVPPDDIHPAAFTTTPPNPDPEEGPQEALANIVNARDLRMEKYIVKYSMKEATQHPPYILEILSGQRRPSSYMEAAEAEAADSAAYHAGQTALAARDTTAAQSNPHTTHTADSVPHLVG